MRWKLCCALAALITAGVAIGLALHWRTPAAVTNDFPLQFHDVTDDSGITFVHTDGSSGQRFIVESMSTGIATFDYDGDGLIDIYFPNGAPLPGAHYDTPPRHALYRNLGDWKFRDVTDQAGLAVTGYGMGVTVGDLDNDGWQDIYLNNFGAGILLHNQGDGTFTDITQAAGVAGLDQVAAGVCFLDIDGDGALDLYVGNYIDLDLDRHEPVMINGHPSYPSPKSYPPVPDTLYRNCGDGSWLDVSLDSGIGLLAGRSMGMTCADHDNDGDTDIFVLNDVQESFFFVNDGRGKFEEGGLQMGVAINGSGEFMANMGVDCGDYDNDGYLDFYTTNYQAQWPMLLRNLNGNVFDDVTPMTHAGAGCFPYVNWGCGMADFDNDGLLDIFVGNGHTEDNIEERDDTTHYRCPDTVLHNTAAGRFVDITDRCGVGSLPPHASRGVALDDLDNDGDVDVVILNSRERPTVLRNMVRESEDGNHWLELRLRGVRANRDGVGARVRVTAGDLVLIDEVHSGRGYQSHWGSRLHFGLGNRDRVDRIEISWIGGGQDVLQDVAADRLLTVIQGRS